MDDAAARVLGDEPTRCSPRDGKGGGQVHVDDAAPVLERHVEGRRTVDHARVADRDVQTAERVRHLVDRALRRLPVGHVCTDDESPPAESFDVAHRLGAVSALNDPDVSTEPRERDGRGAADSTACTRHREQPARSGTVGTSRSSRSRIYAPPAEPVSSPTGRAACEQGSCRRRPSGGERSPRARPRPR